LEDEVLLVRQHTFVRDVTIGFSAGVTVGRIGGGFVGSLAGGVGLWPGCGAGILATILNPEAIASLTLGSFVDSVIAGHIRLRKT
jgi:hypothetical protein